jgi:hypothetical protein
VTAHRIQLKNFRLNALIFVVGCAPLCIKKVSESLELVTAVMSATTGRVGSSHS